RTARAQHVDRLPGHRRDRDLQRSHALLAHGRAEHRTVHHAGRRASRCRPRDVGVSVPALPRLTGQFDEEVPRGRLTWAGFGWTPPRRAHYRAQVSELSLSGEVADALAEGRPVVALESTLI